MEHYLVQKVVHPLSKGAQRLGSKANLSLSGNTGVWVKSGYAKLWRHMGSRRVRVMKKLDKSKVEWIISQKRKGVTTSSIAETMNVSARRVKKLWARYRHADAGKIGYPVPMGRPKNGLPGRREHSAVLTARTGGSSGRRAPAQNHTGKHRNRYSMQHHARR